MFGLSAVMSMHDTVAAMVMLSDQGPMSITGISSHDCSDSSPHVLTQSAVDPVFFGLGACRFHTAIVLELLFSCELI